MIISSVLTLGLLAASVSVSAAPLPSAATPTPEDDPLDTAETGHFRRKGLWRKLLKHLSGYGGLALDLIGGGNYLKGGYGGYHNYYSPVGFTGHHHHAGIGGYSADLGHFPSYPLHHGGLYGVQGGLYGGHRGVYGVHGEGYGVHGGGISSWDLLDGYGWGGYPDLHYNGEYL